MALTRYLRDQRSSHIRWPRWWRRHPFGSLLFVILLIGAYVDHRGYLGWQGDDRTRYHGKLFTCINVVDGDTIDINISDGRYSRTRVRLWGVDTPEVGDADRAADFFGPQASRFTKSRLQGRPVRLELAPRRTRDKYGRVLAYVYDEENRELFNATLIETGHAYADRRFDHPRQTAFIELEDSARRNKRGLWQSITKDKMPKWRRHLDD